jgi:hypothetical protein
VTTIRKNFPVAVSFLVRFATIRIAFRSYDFIVSRPFRCAGAMKSL